MINDDIKQALVTYTENMQNDISLVLQTGTHKKRAELLTFLKDFASVSERINVIERDTRGDLRSPVSFMIEVDGKPNGVTFSGIPSGHEFNSLVLAVLHSSGTEMKLDEGQIRSIVDKVVTRLVKEEKKRCHPPIPMPLKVLRGFSAMLTLL